MVLTFVPVGAKPARFWPLALPEVRACVFSVSTLRFTHLAVMVVLLLLSIACVAHA